MVARGVSQFPVTRARWIVLPPFRHDIAWRNAVATAVTRAGLRLYDLDAAPGVPPPNDSNDVILTADARQAAAAGVTAEAVAGLITGSGMRLYGNEAPDELPAHTTIVTELMGAIELLPADRVFRNVDFASEPVEILSGLMLHRPPPEMAPLLSPRLQALTDAVALLDPEQPHATWAPELFNYDSRKVPGGTRGQLDLTGRPRFMITGPYIAMPKGRWRATYRLTFDDRGSRPRFRIDWGSQADFVSEEFVPGRAGVFEIAQEYIWTEPAPCELRIIVLEGVFDGRMTFSGAQIARID